MRLSPGDRLGPYEIRSALGAGGMGEVYRARDTRLDRDVAIKILGEDLVGSPEAAKRFEREARAVAALQHDNIVRIYEFDIESNTPIVVTELLEGHTLRRRREPRMPWQRAAEIAAAVAGGLAAAHEHSIIHRDIKPENIFLTSEGRVKILDFGIAHVMEATSPARPGDFNPSEPTPTAPAKRAIGTIGYGAPEQLTIGAATPPTDIFSLGVVLYEMLSGTNPFNRASSAETIAAILHDDPPPLTAVDSRIPVALDRIVRRCLAKSPEQRFQSARDLAILLKEVQEGEVAPAPPKRMRKWAYAGALVFAAAAIGAAFIYKPGASAAGRPPITSVAILPLANTTRDPNFDYVSDGITDSLINQLSALPNVRITARPTVFQYKAKVINPIEVGKELGVAALATGRVDLHGDDIVIAADLIDAKSGTELWGNTYRRARAEIYTLPADIARQIAGELRVRLNGAEQARLQRRPTNNALAFDLYLRGLHGLNLETKAGFAEAIQYFSKAVNADPDYARAWADLAESYARFSRYEDPHQMRTNARRAVRRALELDPELAEAHASLGLLYMSDEWDLKSASREFQKAIALNPNLATAHKYYCSALRYQGRFPEAIREARIAKTLDPLSRGNAASLASTLLFAGQIDQAIAAVNELLRDAPDYDTGHYMLGSAYELQGRSGDACSEFIRGDELAHRDPELIRKSRSACNAEGLRGYNKVELQYYLNEAPLKDAYIIATLYLSLGDKDRAYEYLEKGYNDHSVSMLLLKIDPAFKTIRNEAHFKDLLRRIGLEPSPSDKIVAPQDEQRGNTPVGKPEMKVSDAGETYEQSGAQRRR